MRKPLLSSDEWVDRFLCRPLAKPLVQVFAKTPMTPNHVTLLAGLSGIAGGVFVVLGQLPWAALCILLFMIFDCGDGQLARLRGGGTPLGRAIDGLGDYAAALGIHVGLIIAYLRAGEPVWWAVGVPLAAGLCMAWKAMLFDRYKRRYSGSEDDLSEVREEVTKHRGFIAWYLRQFLSYAERLQADGVTVRDLDAYKARVRGPYWLFFLNGPTMHYSLAALSFLLKEPRIYLYLCIGPMMLLEFVACVWQPKAERRDPPVVVRKA